MLYAVVSEYLDGRKYNSCFPGDSNEYFDSISEATEYMFLLIKRLKKNHFHRFAPIDMSHKHNIGVYEVDVWKNVVTSENKIDFVKKVVPSLKNSHNAANLIKYLDLCDQPDMTVSKLCLEIYGQNMSEEEYNNLINERLAGYIISIDNLLPSIVNEKPYIIVPSYDRDCSVIRS